MQPILSLVNEYIRVNYLGFKRTPVPESVEGSQCDEHGLVVVCPRAHRAHPGDYM
jgi:hypothetical protein